MPEKFSCLKQLREKLWEKAEVVVNGKKKIYTQVREAGIYYSAVEELLLPIAQQTSDTNLLVESAEIGEGIPWEAIKSGYIKVKANFSGEFWDYYDTDCKGGRKKTRRRKRRGGTRKAEKKALPTISSNFESGNIKKININTKKNDYSIILEIEDEPYHSGVKKKYQNWFYFKTSNVQRKTINYTIQNIRIFDNDWRGFNVCYSYDNKNWKRIKTSFSKKEKTLKWTHKTTKRHIFFAYYPPYTTLMKNTLINKYKNRKGVKHIVLNKNIDTLLLGTGPLHIYIVARQHPGETIGSWMTEGFLKAYFSSKQRKVIEKTFTIVIIPMANPTGVKSGHWYTNKKGQNLNRSWRHNKTPETTAIKKLINSGPEGILYLDLHGDEGASKHFITTCIEKKNNVRGSFNKIMGKFCPNFQLKDYYKRKGHKVYGTMDCFDKKKTLTIEGAMKHPLYKHKTLQDEGIKIGEAIYKTITNKIGCVCIDN